jgi:hypothetical protein
MFELAKGDRAITQAPQVKSLSFSVDHMASSPNTYMHTNKQTKVVLLTLAEILVCITQHL